MDDLLNNFANRTLTDHARDKIAKSYLGKESEKTLAIVAMSVKQLNENFNKGLISEELHEKAFEQLDYIVKSRVHKYLRREGVKGKYKYIYDEKKESGTLKDKLSDDQIQALLSPQVSSDNQSKSSMRYMLNNPGYKIGWKGDRLEIKNAEGKTSLLTRSLPKETVEKIKGSSDNGPGFSITGEYEGNDEEIGGEALHLLMDGAFHSSNSKRDFINKVTYGLTNETSSLSSEDEEKLGKWYDDQKNAVKKSEDTFTFTEEQDAFLFTVHDIIKSDVKTGKIAKKVTVRKKDGGTYMATRYFSQEEIDEMEGKGTTQEELDESTSKSIEDIFDRNKSKAAQLRELIKMGIHHPTHLMALNSDYNESNVKHYLKEAGIDPKSFDFAAKRKAATVNPDTGEIEYEDEDEPDFNALEQEMEAMLRADGLLFDDEELMKPNEHTGKDAVDTVQDKFTNQIAKGFAKLAMFYGTGGVGKTWGVKQVMTNPGVKDEFGNEFGNELVEYDSELQPNEDEYDFIKFTGKIAPSKLYRALYEHNGKVIMLDDCDSVLEDEAMVNMLKAATDTTLEDVVWDGNPIKPTNADKDTPPLPTRFKFTGGVIFISNLPETKLRKVAGPLLDSRALSLDITRTKEQTIDKLDRIKQFMEFEDTKGNPIPVKAESRDAAVEFVKKWSKYADIATINARTFGSLAKDYEASRYKTLNDFLKSHSARSIMNVLDHQVKKYLYDEKKKEMREAKEKAALMKSIHQHTH